MRAGGTSFSRSHLNPVTAAVNGTFNPGMLFGGRRRTKGIEDNGAGAHIKGQ